MLQQDPLPRLLGNEREEQGKDLERFLLNQGRSLGHQEGKVWGINRT